MKVISETRREYQFRYLRFYLESEQTSVNDDLNYVEFIIIGTRKYYFLRREILPQRTNYI